MVATFAGRQDIVFVMPRPPVPSPAKAITKPVDPVSQHRKASQVGAHTDWIIVASKQDADAVDHIMRRAPANGVKISRVLWVDDGPIKFYCCDEGLWEGLFAS